MTEQQESIVDGGFFPQDQIKSYRKNEGRYDKNLMDISKQLPQGQATKLKTDKRAAYFQTRLRVLKIKGHDLGLKVRTNKDGIYLVKV